MADQEATEFWTERHLCVLATPRADGSIHLVPVGATYDPTTGTARVITSATSVKVRNIRRAPGPVRAALTQVDGRRWTTIEGLAHVTDDPAAVKDAEERYARRYRAPRPNPARVVIEIAADRVLGTCRVALPRR